MVCRQQLLVRQMSYGCDQIRARLGPNLQHAVCADSHSPVQQPDVPFFQRYQWSTVTQNGLRHEQWEGQGDEERVPVKELASVVAAIAQVLGFESEASKMNCDPDRHKQEGGNLQDSHENGEAPERGRANCTPPSSRLDQVVLHNTKSLVAK